MFFYKLPSFRFSAQIEHWKFTNDNFEYTDAYDWPGGYNQTNWDETYIFPISVETKKSMKSLK